MSLEDDLKGTTSRRAIVVGMTNTDQVAFWQGGHGGLAETIEDVDEGGAPAGGEDVDPNTGLTAAEQALFDGMRTGDTPADSGEQGDDGAGESGGDPGADDTGGEPAPDGGAGPLARDPADKTGGQQGKQAPADSRTPPKTVNYSKYQRELQRANKLATDAQAAAQQEREARIKLAARVDLINEAIAAQRQSQEAAAAQPDPNAPPENPFDEDDIDPTEDYAAAVAQVNRRMRYQREEATNLQTTVQVSNEDRQMKDTFERDFRSFAATPEGKDLPAAYQFLKDSRLTEICITKFDKDPNDPNEVFTPAEVQEMVNLFNQEEKWVVSNAITQRKSPAMAIMKLARSRGFKPPAAAPAPRPGPKPAPGARPAAGARPAVPGAARPQVPAVRRAPQLPAAMDQEDPTAVLAQLRQNQEDARSLSDGGGVPPGGLSAEMILRLDDSEFGELLETLSEHQLQSLMGRDFPGGR